MKPKILVLMLLITALGYHKTYSQSFSPAGITKGLVIGGGIHSTFSISKRSTSTVGPHLNIAYLTPKLGIVVSPQFNIIQFESVSNRILSGNDFSSSFLGLYRLNEDWSIGGGFDVQFIQKVEDTWETVNDISLMAGTGYNWKVGKNFMAVSGFFRYNPSAEDFSIGVDLSYNLPL